MHGLVLFVSTNAGAMVLPNEVLQPQVPHLPLCKQTSCKQKSSCFCAQLWKTLLEQVGWLVKTRPNLFDKRMKQANQTCSAETSQPTCCSSVEKGGLMLYLSEGHWQNPFWASMGKAVSGSGASACLDKPCCCCLTTLLNKPACSQFELQIVTYNMSW